MTVVEETALTTEPAKANGWSRVGLISVGAGTRKIFKLLAEVGFLNPGIGGEFPGRSLHHNATCFQHVRAVRMSQSSVCVLFDQQDSGSFTSNFVNRFENRMHNERSQAK